jgi:general secretion pathway protein B
VSYILEALRRADSERDRGEVPGLGTQAFARSDTEARPRRGLPLWVWLLAGVLLALLAGLYRWQASADHEPASALASEPGLNAAADKAPDEPRKQPSDAAAGTPSSSLVQEDNSSTLAAATPVEPISAVTLPAVPPPKPKLLDKPALPKPKRSEIKRTPDVELAAAALPAANTAEPTVATGNGAATVASPALPNTAASQTALASAAPPLLRYQDLPQPMRSQLPALTVSGSVYSPQAKNRMLILNGQVFHEGDEVSAGLKLQQIKLKSAVLKFQGQPFEMAY